MHCLKTTGTRAFTLVEVLVVISVAALLAAVLYPALRPKRHNCGTASRCVNNLKQVGLAFRIYSNDNGDAFPWGVSQTNGGTREIKLKADASRHFAVASNELNTPKILSCPSDTTRSRTAEWASFGNSNLSYFVGIDSNETNAMALLAGDRDIARLSGSSGIVAFSNSAQIGWSGKVHPNAGNVAFADGSVQQLSTVSIQSYFTTNTPPVIRLALP